jgi:hypothetical protein
VRLRLGATAMRARDRIGKVPLLGAAPCVSDANAGPVGGEDNRPDREMAGRDLEAVGSRDHRCGALMHRMNDLGVVDPA